MDQYAGERTPLAIYLQENYCFNLLYLENFQHFKWILHQNLFFCFNLIFVEIHQILQCRIFQRTFENALAAGSRYEREGRKKILHNFFANSFV